MCIHTRWKHKVAQNQQRKALHFISVCFISSTGPEAELGSWVRTRAAGMFVIRLLASQRLVKEVCAGVTPPRRRRCFHNTPGR